MAGGIGAAGAYGAAGAAVSLQDLIADRLAAEQLARERSRQDTQDRRQVERDRAADEHQAWQRKTSEDSAKRLAAQEQRLAERELLKEGTDLATAYAGSTISGEALKRYPKTMQELIAKPKPARLASKSIGGFSSMPGAKVAGELALEAHEGVAPDSYELQLPQSEKMRIAQERQAAADTKAGKDRELSERRLDETRRHNEQLEALRAAGAGRGREMTPNQQFNAISSLGRAYQTNTKAAREIQQSYTAIEGGLAALRRGDKTNGEQAIVMGFNKILDPNSVVREGEYDRTAQGQALIQRARALADRVGQGGVIAPEVLQNMATLARTYYDRAATSVQAEQRRVKAQAEHWDLPSHLIFVDDDDQEPPATDGGRGTAPAGRTAGPDSGPARSPFRITNVRPAGR